MRAIVGYLIIGSLAFVLVGCAMPYYAAPPARVYYPLQRAGIYYAPQRASISYPGPRASSSPDWQQSRSPKIRRMRHPPGEQSQAARRHDLGRGTARDSSWIDPEP